MDSALGHFSFSLLFSSLGCAVQERKKIGGIKCSIYDEVREKSLHSGNVFVMQLITIRIVRNGLEQFGTVWIGLAASGVANLAPGPIVWEFWIDNQIHCGTGEKNFGKCVGRFKSLNFACIVQTGYKPGQSVQRVQGSKARFKNSSAINL